MGLLWGLGLGLGLSGGLMLAAWWFNLIPDVGTGLGMWFGLFTTGLGIGLGTAPWFFPDVVEVRYDPPVQIVQDGQRQEVTYTAGAHQTTYQKYRPATIEEADWIQAEADFLSWVREKRTLDGPTHIGLSVQNATDWGELLAPLEAYGGTVPRQKGVLTLFMPGWDATRLMNAVLAGYVRFPLDKRPPKVTPFPTSRAALDAMGPGLAGPLKAE